jgi:hypothetical protein
MRIKVADLKNPADQRDMQKLQRLFGIQGAQLIIGSIQPPNQKALRKDTIIWQLSTRGSYTVKDGYILLNSPRPAEGISVPVKEICTMIWGMKNLIPRV